MTKIYTLILALLLIGATTLSAACTATPVSQATGTASTTQPTISVPAPTRTSSPVPPTPTPSPVPPTPTPSPIPPTPTLTPTPSPIPPTPTALPLPTQVFERNSRNRSSQPSFDDFRLKGEIIAETTHFRFYADQGYFPVGVEEFKKQAEVVFDYVSNRLKTSPERKIALSFRRPSTSPCPARGLAMPGERPPRIFIMADEQTSQEQVLGVLAHEVGHILHAASDLSGSNRALNEGLASWAAGDYWKTWQKTPSLDARVRTYLEQSTYLPLYENYAMQPTRQELASSNPECLAQRDILYTEWATFIGYLIEQYGWEKLQALFESPTYEEEGSKVIVRAPDFPGVYGSSLNQLEAAWLEQLVAGDRSLPQ